MILVEAIRDFLFSEPGEQWLGTAEMLFEELTQCAEENEIDVAQKGWPANASWLIRYLRNWTPELLAAGIDFERGREGTLRRRHIIRIWLVSAVGAVDTGNPDSEELDWWDIAEADWSDEQRADVEQIRAKVRDSRQADREREEEHDKILGCLATSRIHQSKYSGF